MIELTTAIPAWGIPDISPFVAKVEAYLRMAELPHRLCPLPGFDLSKTPKGKIPVIRDGSTTVSDSALIIEYLRSTYRDRIDNWLTPEQQAISHAFARMLDESFYWFVIQIRYRDAEAYDVHYAPIWAEVFSTTPSDEKARIIQGYRTHILDEFYKHGMGRHSVEEVEHFAAQQYDAMATCIGNKPYFFGDRPSSLDAQIFGFLANVMYTPFPSPIRDYGNDHPVIGPYVKRIYDRYYADLKGERVFP